MSRAARALVTLFLANGAAVVLIRRSGLEPRELDGLAGRLNAAGRITALVGTYLVLVQLILRTHVSWLVAAFGKDALKAAHTRNAYAAFALLGAHALLQLAGYALAERVDPARELATLVLHYDGVLLGIFSLLVLAGLTIVSLEPLRHRIAWPLWRALHLFTYVAVALSVPHQLATGSDFVDAPLAVAYWSALLAAATLVIVAATLPRLWTGTIARLRRGDRAQRPHPAIAGVAAMLIGMYLIGTARLAPPLRAAATATATPRSTIGSPAGTAAPRATVAPASEATAGIAGDVIETPYGDLQVRVFLSAGRIEDVEMVVKPAAQRRSRQISDSVDPWLRKRAIAAQSAAFDVLSGATYTSVGYMRSLETALRAASMDQR